MNLKELLWRAARVAVPFGVLVTGCRGDGEPARVTANEQPEGDVCAGSAQWVGCEAFFIPVSVTTQLDAGTPLTNDECAELCRHVACHHGGFPGCRLTTQTNVDCDTGCVEGRPPTNGRMPDVTEQWARMAWFEAQSAHEFEHLATQLEQLNAPTHFVSRARLAAEEERGHARIAERRAGHSVNVEDTPVQSRTLQELAFANFLGGCINECASAVRSARQADELGEADLHQLAEEEMGHAEFSWELHAWLVTSLDADQRRELAVAAEKKVVEMGDNALLETSLWRPAIASLLQ